MTPRWGEKPIRGVLFDKDGTLFDFQKSWGRLGEEVIATLSAGEPRLARRLAEVAGYDLATGRYRAGSPLVAGAISEIVEGWLAVLPQWRADELTEWLDIQATAAAAGGLTPAAEDLPGLLSRLRRAGLTLGVATHDSEAAARAQLSRHGVVEQFAFIAGYDSGHGLKPGPGMMRAFEVATGVRAAETVVAGDSLHDLGLARSSGAAAAIGVLTGPADADHLGPHADLVIASIEGLPEALGMI